MNKKKKIFLSLPFIADLLFTGLYGIDFKDGCLTVSEIFSNPNAYVGKNVNVMEIVEYGKLEVAPKMTAFKLRDGNNENLKVDVEYTGNLSSNLAEGKKVSIIGIMVSESVFKAKRIVTGCPSKYTE